MQASFNSKNNLKAQNYFPEKSPFSEPAVYFSAVNATIELSAAYVCNMYKKSLFCHIIGSSDSFRRKYLQLLCVVAREIPYVPNVELLYTHTLLYIKYMYSIDR